MSWSREEALTDPASAEPMKFLSEFRFRLKDIPTEITVRLYQPVHSGSLLLIEVMTSLSAALIQRRLNAMTTPAKAKCYTPRSTT
jgi:hypothetical protein